MPTLIEPIRFCYDSILKPEKLIFFSEDYLSKLSVKTDQVISYEALKKLSICINPDRFGEIKNGQKMQGYFDRKDLLIVIRRSDDFKALRHELTHFFLDYTSGHHTEKDLQHFLINLNLEDE